MITGTRHEKVGLIALSYAIGFTTAYIAFGLTGGNLPTYNLEQSRLTASLSTVSHELDASGLYVNAAGERSLISINHREVPDLDDTPLQGVHETVSGLAWSTDRRYLYFCEHQPNREGCVPFIYNPTKNYIYPVIIEATGANAAPVAGLTWQGNMLGNDTYVSIDQSTPWRLAPR